MRRAHAGLAILLLLAAAVTVASPVPTPVPLTTGADSGEPVLSTSADGALVLSWLEPVDATRHALRWSRWQGAGWSTPATALALDSLFVNWADVPAVIATRGDTLFAHVLRRTASGTYDYAVHVSCSVDGGAHWTAPRPLHAGGARGEHGFVSVVPAPGGADYVWLDGRAMAADPENGSMMLRHTRVGPTGEPGPETLLDARTCECCRTGLARTHDGLVAVYRDRSEHEVRDIHIVRRVAGAWLDPAPVAHDGWVVEGCPVNGPAVATAGDTLLVAWTTSVRDTLRLHAAWSFDGGATFDAVRRLDDGAVTGRADVTLLPNGTAAVSWIEGEGATARIRVRRVAPAGAPGAPITVADTHTARRAGFPRIACMGDDLVFAWTEPGAHPRVRTARLPVAALPN
ncbi:MAG: hypothetical protein RL760_1097 [Candidatus Eisenbacteria bacterium]